jgi:hypothetical protein
MPDPSHQTSPPASRPDDHDEITIGPGVQDADIGGEIVLLHPEDGSYFALNETGAQLWRELGATAVPRAAAVRHAAEAICAQWLIDRDQAELDLHELLDDLLHRGLVAVAPRRRP